jgi:hypothetical protein
VDFDFRLRARDAAIGVEPIGSAPVEFTARIKAEVPKWPSVVREAHIKPE